MKNRLFLLASLLFVVAGVQAQSKSYYIVDGVKYQSTSSNGSWVGETAVFNSNDGSFQVLVKTIPTKNKNYKIRDNASFSYGGLETEASIAMLQNNFEDYYGSVLPNKGKISVKVKKGVITITVKDALVCNSENTRCKTVSGQIVLE